MAAAFYGAGERHAVLLAGKRDRREPDKFGYEEHAPAQKKKTKGKPEERAEEGAEEDAEEGEEGEGGGQANGWVKQGDETARRWETEKNATPHAHAECREVVAFANALQALADYCDGYRGGCATIEGSKRKFRRLAVEWRKAVEATGVGGAPFADAGGSGAEKACAEAYLVAAKNPACAVRAEDAARAIACHIQWIDRSNACGVGDVCGDDAPRVARRKVAEWCLNACRLEAFYALYGDQDLQKRCDLLQFVAPLWDGLVGECSLSLMAGARHCY